MSKRKNPPVDIKREVLLEAGYRCAVPTCRTLLLLDLHHIEHVSEDGPNEAHNLIALCPNCHALYHRGEIPVEAIKAWKNALIVLNKAFDREAIDDLIFIEKLATSPLPISADGVLRFSKLIAADLVKFQLRSTRMGAYAAFAKIRPSTPKYFVELTARGKAFLQAWKNGDRSAIRSALETRIENIDPVEEAVKTA